MIIVGVDEAGRGPLAGPVVAASVSMREPLSGLSDSKKLSPKKRKELFSLITSGSNVWSYATASPFEIDRLNIREATRLAMVRSVQALRVKPDLVLVDGRDTIHVECDCRAIIKGDQTEQSIMAASIIAKTIRDYIMETISHQCPYHCFDQHKGYPTKLHREMIGLHGVTRYHRLSYKPCQ